MYTFTLLSNRRPGKIGHGASSMAAGRCWTLAVAVAAVATALARPTRAGAQARSDTVSAKVDAIFADVNTTSSPGCALGVIRDGALIYARGYGMANLDEDIALSPSSAFYIASTSKQFAAASILLLAQQRKLSLDDDVHHFVPELPDYGARVSIRHLLHHTSGIRDYLALLMGLGAGRVENVMSDDDIIALIARQKTLNFVAGAEYSYSNSGYFLLGVIVKRVTGMSLREYADANIFRPLGMLHTHFHDDRLQSVRRRVIGYDAAAAGGFRIDFYANFQGVGDGGLWSTVEDLALWDRNFYDPKIGGPELVREQLTPGQLNNGDTISYGSGLMLGRYRGLETVSHGGSFMGYRTEFLRFPGRRLSVICLCNLSTSDPSMRARKVADIYLAGDFPRGLATADSAPVPFVDVASTTLRALSGTYRNPATGMIYELTVKDGHLLASAFRATVQLNAVSPIHFRGASPVALDLVFEPRPPGAPARVAVAVGGADAKPERYDRIERTSLAAAQLAPYAGRYRSGELLTTYTFSAIGDTLFVEIPNRQKLALVPTIRDAFAADGIGFTFDRDAAKRLLAVVVQTAQARNLRFERLSAAIP